MIGPPACEARYRAVIPGSASLRVDVHQRKAPGEQEGDAQLSRASALIVEATPEPIKCILLFDSARMWGESP